MWRTLSFQKLTKRALMLAIPVYSIIAAVRYIQFILQGTTYGLPMVDVADFLLIIGANLLGLYMVVRYGAKEAKA